MSVGVDVAITIAGSPDRAGNTITGATVSINRPDRCGGVSCEEEVMPAQPDSRRKITA